MDKLGAPSNASRLPNERNTRGARTVSRYFPIALTPLVGRDHEITLASSLLKRDDVRLLTLTGPGGIGKTRLAIRVAADLREWFASGVEFVALAPVQNSGLVAATIAHSLGLAEELGTPLRDTLIAALRDSAMLLVVDNFEHVLSEAPLLTELLAACPHLKILATCRSLLRVTGEQSIPVPPLDFPLLDDKTSFEQLSRSAAVELFVSRARSVDPSFALIESNARLIAEICARVDGLPLAIELAAAQIGVLPLESLLSRIRARLPLPIAGPRDVPTRLRTVRDAIIWSYDLLLPQEQSLFRCFGVFVGGFSLKSAEYLVRFLGQTKLSPEPIDASVLRVLATLVECSLVRQQPWQGESRFSMLEPIRDFALEELIRHGEESTARLAHAEWCLSEAETSGIATFRPVSVFESRILDIETANFLAALTWLQQQNDADRVLRLASSLGQFWNEHGYSIEGRFWLERALANPGADVPHARALALVQLGRYVFFRGDPERAKALFTEAGSIFKDQNDLPALADILVGHGAIACQQSEFDRAELLLNEALATAETIPDPVAAASATANALSNLGVLARNRGEFGLARGFHERAIRMFLDHDDTLGAIRSHCDLGDLSRDAKDYETAIEFYRECMTMLGDRGDTRVIRDVLIGTALAAAASRRPESASRLLGAAESLREQLGFVFVTPADRIAAEQAAAIAQATLGESGYLSALADGRELGVSAAINEAFALQSSAWAPVVVPQQPGIRLSLRQREVLHLLAAERSDREIAESLFISLRTAEGHVAALMSKFEVENRSAAVAAAIAAGLIKAPTPSAPDPMSKPN